jgi:hypothetical protein
MWPTLVIFVKLVKVSNHTLGENSSNLVTLAALYTNRIDATRRKTKITVHTC